MCFEDSKLSRVVVHFNHTHTKSKLDAVKDIEMG